MENASSHASIKKMLVVEGNIGAGKSTFLSILQRKLPVDVVFEPTNKWQQVGEDGNLLDLFYKDTLRWAYTFQSYAFISRIQSLLDNQKKSKHSIFTYVMLKLSYLCLLKLKK